LLRLFESADVPDARWLFGSFAEYWHNECPAMGAKDVAQRRIDRIWAVYAESGLTDHGIPHMIGVVIDSHYQLIASSAITSTSTLTDVYRAHLEPENCPTNLIYTYETMPNHTSLLDMLWNTSSTAKCPPVIKLLRKGLPEHTSTRFVSGQLHKLMSSGASGGVLQHIIYCFHLGTVPGAQTIAPPYIRRMIYTDPAEFLRRSPIHNFSSGDIHAILSEAITSQTMLSAPHRLALKDSEWWDAYTRSGHNRCEVMLRQSANASYADPDATPTAPVPDAKPHTKPNRWTSKTRQPSIHPLNRLARSLNVKGRLPAGVVADVGGDSIAAAIILRVMAGDSTPVRLERDVFQEFGADTVFLESCLTMSYDKCRKVTHAVRALDTYNRAFVKIYIFALKMRLLRGGEAMPLSVEQQRDMSKNPERTALSQQCNILVCMECGSCRSRFKNDRGVVSSKRLGVSIDLNTENVTCVACGSEFISILPMQNVMRRVRPDNCVDTTVLLCCCFMCGYVTDTKVLETIGVGMYCTKCAPKQRLLHLPQRCICGCSIASGRNCIYFTAYDNAVTVTLYGLCHRHRHLDPGAIIAIDHTMNMLLANK
jgi:hypothetical protein